MSPPGLPGMRERGVYRSRGYSSVELEADGRARARPRGETPAIALKTLRSKRVQKVLTPASAYGIIVLTLNIAVQISLKSHRKSKR